MKNKTTRHADSTACIHAGEERHGRKAPLTTEIVQTSVFTLPNVAELRRYAEGKSDAYLYSRYGNPTITAAEEKIAALEGGEACVVTASGMAAEMVMALGVCQAGDEIVSMLDIYGGTIKLFDNVLTRCGMKTVFVPYQELKHLDRFVTKRTRMLFLEAPTNPTLRCVDIAALAKMAHQHNICVAVDNTFATPILQKPLDLGADLVVHSATKYLGGHSDLTAGAVVGARKWIDPIRTMMIQSGGCLDPGAGYLLIRGLKTLEIRVERACRNAARIAEYLQKHRKVERVMYPGLPGCEGHEIASRQMRDYGMMLSFDIRGGGRAAEKFIDSLELWYLATSLGGVESTVSYPVLSSHSGLDKRQLELLDVSAATVRLSVGIEDVADLIADLARALG
ncbi:MAG TPA: aminotransferase class I/II-fold pyridoxal phosphate-dependent enzyme [Clostridia bacterium]|nr:aminotransferase class I/II-fold pyridoxal phosphate-dependent enzyme [Clostridia bacterium]